MKNSKSLDDGSEWAKSEGLSIDDPVTEPEGMTKVGARPGYKTSQGWLTILFTVVSLLFSYWSIPVKAEQINNVYQAVMTIVTVIGPLLAVVPVLKNYINSRGKIQSNQIWATASMNIDWKNPNTYSEIIGTVGDKLKIPGLNRIDNVIEGISGAASLGGDNSLPVRTQGIAEQSGQYVGSLARYEGPMSKDDSEYAFNELRESLGKLIDGQSDVTQHLGLISNFLLRKEGEKFVVNETFEIVGITRDNGKTIEPYTEDKVIDEGNDDGNVGARE